MINFVASGQVKVTDVPHVKPDCNESKWSEEKEMIIFLFKV